jgi:Uma2 family endonuclease
MVQALQQFVTFDEFNEWLPASSECRYELHRGDIFQLGKLNDFIEPIAYL